MSATGDEKKSIDTKKALQNIQTQKAMSNVTGAEQVGQPKRADITITTSNINIERIQRQKEQATKNVALAATALSTINKNIELLRTGPSKFTVTDSVTGETRKAVGRDIDELKALRADIMQNVLSTDAFLQQAPNVIKYYENKKEYAKTGKDGSTYSVTFLATSGEEQKESFDTRKEARAFADALNLASEDKAKTRATERAFIGLTLSEAASVVKQKRKGALITKGYETVTDSKQIEELIEKGRISPEQSVILSKGGEIELRTIDTQKQQLRYREAIDDQVTVLLDRGQKALGNTNVSSNLGKRGKPLTEDELKDAINRANYMKYATTAGVIIGAGASIDPRTYIDLGKSGVKAVLNPAQAIASTAGVAIALKTAYDTDPIATSGLLLGSVMGSYMTQRVLGPSVKAFYQKGIVPAKTKIYGKITDATQTFYEALKADTPTDIAQALQYPLFNELAQAKKFKPISDNILKTISDDPLAAPSFFDKGPQMSLWDQFRQWKKFDFKYIPADPSKATTGVYNDYVEFLKIQEKYLSSALQKGRTTGTFGEFIQAKKVIVEPGTSNLLDMGLLYFIAKKAKLDSKTEATLIQATVGKYTTPLSETFKLKGDVNDYTVSSVNEQARAFFDMFGPKDTGARLTEENVRIALKAFKEAVELEKTGPMAIQVEAEAVYRTLINSGVSKSKATSIASEYAFGLVTISAMKTASPSEVKDYMGALQMVMADLIQSNVIISNDMVADLTTQFNRALQTEQIQSFQSLFDKADSLNKQFLASGEINDVEYKNIIDETQILIQPQKIDELQDITPILEPAQILEVPPKITPPLVLSVKQKKKRRELNLALFSGKKLLYRVNYQYKGGRQENIGPLEARSLPDALGKAQRKRTGNKTLPTVITVTFIGEKRK